jgi:hypothetical protein
MNQCAGDFKSKTLLTWPESVKLTEYGAAAVVGAATTADLEDEHGATLARRARLGDFDEGKLLSGCYFLSL